MIIEQEDDIGKFIVCTKCNHVNRIHTHFCAKCGSKLNEEKENL